MAGSCARRPLVIQVSITAGQSTLLRFGSLQSYESAVPTIARLLVGEFGLPLPARLTVFVYPTHVAYAEGLAKLGHMRIERAAQIAGYAIGLYQRERLFINDGALRGACVAVWLGLIAHELTHAAQYELSSGRRGRSEQWIREGMADWVAMRVLDRLGVRDGRHRRDQALNEIRQDRGSSYEIAFLMTDVLIERHGLESIVAYFRAFATSDDRFGNFSRAFGVSLEAFAGNAFERLSTDLERGEKPEAKRSPEPFITNEFARDSRVRSPHRPAHHVRRAAVTALGPDGLA